MNAARRLAFTVPALFLFILSMVLPTSYATTNIDKHSKLAVQKLQTILNQAQSLEPTHEPSVTQPQDNLTNAPQDDPTVWKVENVDIRTLTQQISERTGRNFLLSPDVSGRVSLVSGKAISSDALYEVYLAALDVLGLAAIPSADVIKVVRENDMKKSSSRPGDLSSGYIDEVMVHVIPIQHVPANNMVGVLRSLVSTHGHLAAYAPSNSLIIADRASVVRQIAMITTQLDVKTGHAIETIPLKHASATEVATNLRALSQRGDEAALAPFLITADERTNRLIVAASESTLADIRLLVQNLDTKASSLEQTEVIYLKYQRAEDLVPVITNILNSLKKGNDAETEAALALYRNFNGSNAHSDTEGPNTNANSRESSGFVLERTGVQSEPNTNALILTAPPEIMETVTSVVKKLDVRRAQVLVEAVIAEISDTYTKNLGVEWGTHQDPGVVGGTRFGSQSYFESLQSELSPPLDTLTSRSDDLLSLASHGLTLGFVRNGSLRAVLNTLSSDSRVNIISTPTLVALDNSQAEIKIGSSIPFQTGTFTTNADGGSNPFTTVEYRDVGLSLNIVPQITQGETIQLKITQKVDALGNSIGNLVTTSNREISTAVLVDSKDILVLGGLIKTEDVDVVEAVPVLGKIPLAKHLFRHEARKQEKTNLMVFLRPVILRDEHDSHIYTEQKYDFIRDEQLLNQVMSARALRAQSSTLLPPTHESSVIRLPEPFAHGS